LKFPKSACIETLYLELPFIARFDEAKRDGFEYVEFWGWRDKDLAAVKATADGAGIGIAAFNGGQDYSMIDPAHKTRFLDQLKESVDTAQKIGARSVTLLASALGEGGRARSGYSELNEDTKLRALSDTLAECATMAEESGIRMNLEPLNTVTDHAGYFLTHTETAAALTRRIGSPMIKVLYDVYHMQLMEGRLSDTIAQNIDQIGHVHVADVPGRHEPGTGEIRYERVFKQLEISGYNGIVGFELFPATSTREAVRAIMRL
jgi:hydroxypyruvate isomerase